MYVRARVTSFNLLVSRSIVSVQYVCTVPGLCVHVCVCVCVRVFVCRWVCAPVYLHTYNMSENYVYTWVPRGAELHFACAAIFCLGIWHSFLSLHPACQEVFQAPMYSACCDCEVYSADLAYCEHVVNKVLNFERVEAVAAWVMIGTRCV